MGASLQESRQRESAESDASHVQPVAPRETVTQADAVMMQAEHVVSRQDGDEIDSPVSIA
jgi:hypothetical protein